MLMHSRFTVYTLFPIFWMIFHFLSLNNPQKLTVHALSLAHNCKAWYNITVCTVYTVCVLLLLINSSFGNARRGALYETLSPLSSFDFFRLNCGERLKQLRASALALNRRCFLSVSLFSDKWLLLRSIKCHFLAANARLCLLLLYYNLLVIHLYFYSLIWGNTRS